MCAGEGELSRELQAAAISIPGRYTFKHFGE